MIIRQHLIQYTTVLEFPLMITKTKCYLLSLYVFASDIFKYLKYSSYKIFIVRLPIPILMTSSHTHSSIAQ